MPPVVVIARRADEHDEAELLRTGHHVDDGIDRAAVDAKLFAAKREYPRCGRGYSLEPVRNWRLADADDLLRDLGDAGLRSRDHALARLVRLFVGEDRADVGRVGSDP